MHVSATVHLFLLTDPGGSLGLLARVRYRASVEAEKHKRNTHNATHKYESYVRACLMMMMIDDDDDE